MKRILSFISICTISILGVCAFSSLPRDTQSVIKEKYSSWTGVIRVWVCEGMEIDPVRWLNSCAVDFEKARDGAYINIQQVPPAAIASFRESGMNPPDIIIWPAGLLDSSGGLYELTGEYPLRSGLDASPYALPLLTGAYAWIYNPVSLEALPADMHGTPAACAEENLAAMAALSTGLRAGESVDAVIPGVDLGLGGEAAVTPAPEGDTLCRASSMLKISENAREILQSGEVSVMAGDLSDIVALCGAGFSAQVTGDFAYTGAPVLCSIVERDVPSAGERRALCEDFLALLLGDGQEKAALAGAMPAADGTAAHAGDPVLSYIEAQLAGLECVAPPYFGEAQVSEKIYQFIDGDITADEAIGTAD